MSHNQYSQNPYQQGPAQESGHGYAQENPYGQPNPYAQGDDQYEMQDYGNNAYGAQQTSTSAPYTQQQFLDRVQSLRDQIKSLTTDIDAIAQLHQRTLSSTDSQATQQLESYVAQTQIKNTAIKDGIKSLERDSARTTDGSSNTKKQQLKSLRTFFKSELDKYQSIEQDYRQRYREQIGRQYRIVNPDASEQEVQEATQADWGNEGVFQQALRTNRTGHASSVLGNVRARHNELQRIEQTLTELAVLYNDLATVVEQQDPVVTAVEQNAVETEGNMEQGNKQLTVATDHAKRARKLKWWCLGIVVLIIIAVALGVGLGVGLAKSASGN